ncbi:hypothetical protein F4803DRAFT_464372 [Xylaria telfairii]|nr:hypothetical protein F4803DRAFT_464372 [Xylaria telfairii]
MEQTESSILMLTKSCISKFKEIIALHSFKRPELESRLADLNLWADGVGALSRPGSSLDSRLQGRVKDLALVKNVLITLTDSLDHYKDVAEIEKSSDESIRNIDSIIGNLALIGVAIRRTGKASRNRRADRTFNPDEHQEFRTHLECIVLLRPTEEAPFHRAENGDYVPRLATSKLSPLQNRLIDANLRRRHNFCLAQRRSKHQQEPHTQLPASPIISATDNALQNDLPCNVRNADDPQDLLPHFTTKDPKRPVPTISGFSLASTAEGTLQDTTALRRSSPGVAKTQITSIASDAEFPQPPPLLLDQQVAKCPCCCQSLPVNIFTDPKKWKQHIIEDLCPYTCVAENCPAPQLLFCTRREWESHIKQSHLPRWQCPFCDDVDCPTMESMGNHIQIEHPGELLENSFSTILSWSAVQTMGIKSCPLCSSYGPEDSSEIVVHVLQHAYEFALRALPWPPLPVQDLNVLPGGFNLPENSETAADIQKWINEAFHEQVEVRNLVLCDYDRAKHAMLAPMNLSESSDHFLTNGYFLEKPEDKSLKLRSDQSVASDYRTVATQEDISGKTAVSTMQENHHVQLHEGAENVVGAGGGFATETTNTPGYGAIPSSEPRSSPALIVAMRDRMQTWFRPESNPGGVGCSSIDVIHGLFEPDSDVFCTLLVLDFRFDTIKLNRSIIPIYVHLHFSSVGNPSVLQIISSLPEVSAIAPSREVLVSRAPSRRDNTTAIVTVVGTKRQLEVDFGRPNCVTWSLHRDTQTGVPVAMQSAILLKRKDKEEFKCSVHIGFDDNWPRRGITGLHALILFDPHIAPTTDAYDASNLGQVDLEALWSITAADDVSSKLK